MAYFNCCENRQSGAYAHANASASSCPENGMQAISGSIAAAMLIFVASVRLFGALAVSALLFGLRLNGADDRKYAAVSAA